MNNTAQKLNPAEVFIEYGAVSDKTGDSFVLETSSGILQAKRALNCLVEPLPGDLVLFSEDSFGNNYVLSVLDRESDAKISVVFERNTDVRVSEGRLRMTAKDGINMASSEEVSIVSKEFSVNSVEGNISVNRLSFFGSLFDGQVEKIKLVAASCDSVVERITQKVKRSYRFVSEFEQVRAEMLDYLVDKVMSLRGKYTVLTAEEDVRIQGDKILMG